MGHIRVTQEKEGPSVLRVYYDTVIMSARTKKDLQPAEEMAAVVRIEALHDEGRIKRISSRMAEREQARRTDPVERAALLEDTKQVSMVQHDHRILGFNNLDYGRRGFISYPLIDDIVNPELYSKLMAVITDKDDATHLMYAVENDCDVFVTLDTRDILPNLEKLEAVCNGMRIMRPTQLVAELSTS